MVEKGNNFKAWLPLVGIVVVALGTAVGYGSLKSDVAHKVENAEYQATVVALGKDIETILNDVRDLKKSQESQRDAMMQVQRTILRIHGE